MKWQKLDLKNPPKGEILAAYGNCHGPIRAVVRLEAHMSGVRFFDPDAYYYKSASMIYCYAEIDGPIPDLRTTFTEAEKLEIYKKQLECEKGFFNATIRSIDACAEEGHVVFMMDNFKRKIQAQERIAQIDNTLEKLGVQ